MRTRRRKILIALAGLAALVALAAGLSAGAESMSWRYAGSHPKTAFAWSRVSYYLWPSRGRLDWLAVNMYYAGDKKQAGIILYDLWRHHRRLSEFGYVVLMAHLHTAKQPVMLNQATQEALQAYPDSPQVLYVAGIFSLFGGHTNQAIVKLERAAAYAIAQGLAAEDATPILWGQCRAYLIARDFAGAYVAATKDVRAFPRQSVLREALATSLEGLGRYREAAHEWLKASDLPGWQEHDLFEACDCLRRVHQEDRALALLKARVSKGMSFSLHAMLLATIECQRHPRAAQAQIKELSRIAPDNVTIQMLLGASYAWCGDRRTAMRALRAIVPRDYGDRFYKTLLIYQYLPKTERKAARHNLLSPVPPGAVSDDGLLYLDMRDVLAGRTIFTLRHTYFKRERPLGSERDFLRPRLPTKLAQSPPTLAARVGGARVADGRPGSRLLPILVGDSIGNYFEIGTYALLREERYGSHTPTTA